MTGEEEQFLPPSDTGDLEPGVRYELSPDGYVRIIYVTEERRHGETWEALSVELAARNRHLFSLPYFFEADVKWTGPHTFVMLAGVAYKAGSVRVDVDVDADGGKGRCVIAETGQSVCFRDAERLIARAYERHATYPAPRPDPLPPGLVPEAHRHSTPSRPATSLRDWILGLLGAAVVIAGLGAGVYVWNEKGPQGGPEEPRYPPAPKMKTVDAPKPAPSE